MQDMETSDPMAVLTRALGVLDAGLAAQTPGPAAGLRNDPGSQRFMDLVI